MKEYKKFCYCTFLCGFAVYVCVYVCVRVCEVGLGGLMYVNIATDLGRPVKLRCFFVRASEVTNFLPPCLILTIKGDTCSVHLWASRFIIHMRNSKLFHTIIVHIRTTTNNNNKCSGLNPIFILQK